LLKTYLERRLRKLVGDLRRPRFWGCLAIVVGLMMVGRQISGIQILRPLRVANAKVSVAVHGFDPSVIGNTFRQQMDACQYSSRRGGVVCAPVQLEPACPFERLLRGEMCLSKSLTRPGLPPYVSVEDKLSRYGYALRAVAAAKNTAVAIWEQGWLTRTLLGVALVLAALIGVIFVSDVGPSALVGLVLILPGSFGFFVWALKLTLIWMTFAFDLALGLVLWLTGMGISLIALIAQARGLEARGSLVLSAWRKRPAQPPSAGK